jgi:hypothetical protein
MSGWKAGFGVLACCRQDAEPRHFGEVLVDGIKRAALAIPAVCAS